MKTLLLALVLLGLIATPAYAQWLPGPMTITNNRLYVVDYHGPVSIYNLDGDPLGISPAFVNVVSITSDPFGFIWTPDYNGGVLRCDGTGAVQQYCTMSGWSDGYNYMPLAFGDSLIFGIDHSEPYTYVIVGRHIGGNNNCAEVAVTIPRDTGTMNYGMGRLVYMPVLGFVYWHELATGAEGSFQMADGLQYGTAVAVANGSVYVLSGSRIDRYTWAGQSIKHWGTEGSGIGQMNHPQDMEADAMGNIYVADTWNSRILKFDPDGNYLTEFGRFPAVPVERMTWSGIKARWR